MGRQGDEEMGKGGDGEMRRWGQGLPQKPASGRWQRAPGRRGVGGLHAWAVFGWGE